MVKSMRASALVGILAISALSISAARASDDPAPTVTLGSIVRTVDGAIRRMTQSEAVSYCATRGGLPTAKQLALALNSKGVSDIAREGFYEVAPKDEAVFYYDYEAYERPTGDEGSEWFWSSSLQPSYDGYGYVFYGSNGYLFNYYRDSSFNAVRCVGR